MKRLIFILLCLFALQVSAQDGELLDTENGPAPGDVPVDGGISLLLVAGVAYGIHKRRAPRRNEGAKG
jgi:hypothetical protein